MDFWIILDYIIKILICEAHKQKTFTGGQIPEFTSSINTAIKIQIPRIRISILFRGNSSYYIVFWINNIPLKNKLWVFFPNFSTRYSIVGSAFFSLFPVFGIIIINSQKIFNINFVIIPR